ncbi:MAG: hypothetical protein GX587_15020, partial [Bacteroidales bacterium]|nr:hypothetical protein [Bacteroidales bacterium]
AIMTEKVNKARMGFFMGVFNLSVVIPQLISSLVIGFVIKAFMESSLTLSVFGTQLNIGGSSKIIFLIAGVSLVISALLWTLVKDSKGILAEKK